MSTIKKPAVSSKKVTSSKQTAPAKQAPRKAKPAVVSVVEDKSGEELIFENLATMSRLVTALGNTLELLTQKAESMAYHIIATEELLAELITENGINLARVNARIRIKVASGTNSHGNPGKAIDIAAAIASPLPRH